MKLWQISILTIPGREKLLERLLARLNPQIRTTNVEVKIHFDKGELTIGAKRQKVVEECKAKYLNFIDDDDYVPSFYVEKILEKLSKNPYGVGFRGIITSDNIKPVEFVHRAGQKYIDKAIRSSDAYLFYRPLNHLNPIMTDIVKEIGFKDWATFSDRDFSIRLAESGLIDDDIFIDEFMYFYQYRTKRVKV
jgi:hypothetical protein